MPGADPRTRWAACGGWALPVCPLQTRVSFSGCIWAPDHSAGIFQGCWILVESQRRGWGPLQPGPGNAVWTPQSPRRLAAEHLAKPNLQNTKRLALSNQVQLASSGEFYSWVSSVFSFKQSESRHLLNAILISMDTQWKNAIKRHNETELKKEAAHKEPWEKHCLQWKETETKQDK